MSTAWRSRAITLTLALFCGWLGGWTLRSSVKRETSRHETAAIARQSDPLNSAEITRENAEQPVAFFDRLHAALSIQDRAKRERAIAALADDLDVAQIRQTLERVATSHIPNRKAVMAQLFARWGELDPLAAMAFVSELPKLSDRSDAVNAVLNAWMERDPDAAEKWVRALPGGALRNAAWETMILAHAAADPARALVLAQDAKITWGFESPIAEAIFGNWAVNDPKTAAARAFQLREGNLRTNGLQIIAKQWAETDPEEAIKWAQSLPDRLVPGRVSFDGKEVFGGADRTNTATEILGPWLKQDRDTVLRWLTDLPDDPWKTAMVSVACVENVKTTLDAQLAVQLAHLIPRGEQRNEMLSGGATHLTELDPNAGLAMLSHETDKDARLNILEGLATNLKGDNLLAALREVQADGTAIGNLARWADPETAARWALQQPESEKYLPKIGAAWLIKDPERAEEAVRTLPAPLRDDVLYHAALSFQSGGSRQKVIKGFEQAARWIPEIANPVLKQSTYRKLGERWLQIEPESARRWLESAPIADGLKNELLKPQAAGE